MKYAAVPGKCRIKVIKWWVSCWRRAPFCLSDLWKCLWESEFQFLVYCQGAYHWNFLVSWNLPLWISAPYLLINSVSGRTQRLNNNLSRARMIYFTWFCDCAPDVQSPSLLYAQCLKMYTMKPQWIFNDICGVCSFLYLCKSFCKMLPCHKSSVTQVVTFYIHFRQR